MCSQVPLMPLMLLLGASLPPLLLDSRPGPLSHSMFSGDVNEPSGIMSLINGGKINLSVNFYTGVCWSIPAYKYSVCFMS